MGCCIDVLAGQEGKENDELGMDVKSRSWADVKATEERCGE